MRAGLLLLALGTLLAFAGCGPADVGETSVKSQEADTAARIKAKGGEAGTSTE